MTSPDSDRRDEVFSRIEAWRRRAPRLTDEVVTMAHGAGGKASQALLEAVILPAFSNEVLDRLDDGATVATGGAPDVIVTTDSFVVSPRTFPGGSLGDLAVNGTINDLAVSGARPVALTAGFVLEEGLAIAELRSIVADMAAAATRAGVPIVAGDTKVVERGAADGCYVTTTGIGVPIDGLALGADLVRPGDEIVVSGTIGDHGIAIMIARGALELRSTVRSDTAALHGLAGALLAAVPDVRWMRDPTRGGVASSCNELAAAAGLGVVLREPTLPIRREVGGACELLGLDPLHIANEGKLLAVVPAGRGDGAVDALVRSPLGADAAVIGAVSAQHQGLVSVVNAFGGTRILDMLVGDPLPRIC
jgi:hydrogenase expression/formation protein HypE